MELKFAIASAVEMLIVVLVIYGFCHEDSFVAFEERIEDKLSATGLYICVSRQRRLQY